MSVVLLFLCLQTFFIVVLLFQTIFQNVLLKEQVKIDKTVSDSTTTPVQVFEPFIWVEEINVSEKGGRQS